MTMRFRSEAVAISSALLASGIQASGLVAATCDARAHSSPMRARWSSTDSPRTVRRPELRSEIQRLTRVGACACKHFRVQLLGEKLVVAALIDENLGTERGVVKHGRCAGSVFEAD